MNYALLFAGGKGLRMKGSPVPKQFLQVDGKSILIRSILNFEKSPCIDAICVVCIKDWISELQKQIEEEGIKKVAWIAEGAETGQQSIFNGLSLISSSTTRNDDIVLISDGVRPFVSQSIISQCIDCVRTNGSAVVVCPVTETIVMVKNNKIEAIPDRKECYLSKAPQGFFLKDIIEAHQKAAAENRFDCTNSAELMRRYGHSLFIIQDSDSNIKVTTHIDLAIMKTVLQNGSDDLNTRS